MINLDILDRFKKTQVVFKFKNDKQLLKLITLLFQNNIQLGGCNLSVIDFFESKISWNNCIIYKKESQCCLYVNSDYMEKHYPDIEVKSYEDILVNYKVKYKFLDI